MEDLRTIKEYHKKQLEKVSLVLFLALYAFVFIFRIPRMLLAEGTLVWMQASIYGLLGIGGVFLFRGTFLGGFQSWKVAPLKNILWLIGAYVVSVIMLSIASFPAYVMGVEALQNDFNVLNAIQILGIPFSILILGIAGPIVEEIVYRAFLIRKGKFPLWICILLSSSLFAFVHIHAFTFSELVAILPHFSVALIYGILYAVTGNITLPITLHVMNNTVAIILLGSVSIL